MLHWNSVKPEFAWEGSWRDICVRDVGLREWEAAVNAVKLANLRFRFLVDGEQAELPEQTEELFSKAQGRAALWSVFVAGVQLNCHFFDPSEIEFDLDPREVAGQQELEGLLGFMQRVAHATGRVALMTPENMHDAPFLRVAPSGDVEYSSSGGFFEEVARDRS